MQDDGLTVLGLRIPHLVDQKVISKHQAYLHVEYCVDPMQCGRPCTGFKTFTKPPGAFVLWLCDVLCSFNLMLLSMQSQAVQQCHPAMLVCVMGLL